MSGSDRPAGPGAPSAKPTPRPKLSAEDQKELALLEGAIGRIKKSAPAYPYIISTPSMEPYRHYSRQESRAWMLGHLFTPEEEYLQYRSFYYREPYQDCFVQQSGQVDEPKVEPPKSHVSSTPQQGPKKTISLSAYKAKQANGVIAASSQNPSPSPAPPKPSPEQINGLKEATPKASSSPKPNPMISHKRYVAPPRIDLSC